jgi:hypothetical protein
MTIKIKLNTGSDPSVKEEPLPTQASISLQISKTLANNLLINDHQYLDILIDPTEKTISAIPKPFVETDVYDYQRELMYFLFKGGIVESPQPQGAAQFGVIESVYTSNDDVDSLQVVLFELSKFIQKSTTQDLAAQKYDKNIEDRFVDPTDADSTEYGEIKPYQDTPGANSAISSPMYTYTGYGYLY